MYFYHSVRLEPFTQQFLKLQGGHFDLADRMFHSIGRSTPVIPPYPDITMQEVAVPFRRRLLLRSP